MEWYVSVASKTLSNKVCLNTGRRLVINLEESQTLKIERLQKEVKAWEKKYSDQIKTDEEWERYIKMSREEAKEHSKQKVISWALGVLWFLLVIYELLF